MRAVIGVLAVVLGATGVEAGEGYADSLRQVREEKEAHFRTGATTPFTAIAQRAMRPGRPVRVVLVKDTLLLDRPSADPGLPQLEVLYGSDDEVTVRTPMGGQFSLRGRAIGPVPRSLPSGATVHAERFRIRVHHSPLSARLRAFDTALAEERFHGLSFYPPDPRWVREARIEWIPEPDTLALTTSIGLVKRYLRLARLHVTTPAGEEAALTLFAPPGQDGYGFVPFTDATTGRGSYGGGRYLDLPLPAAGAEHLRLDFNTAYNPYCAYTPHYNCPIPPAENELAVAVKAGEKVYK